MNNFNKHIAMKYKKSYIAPQLEVFEYEVERGFAVSQIIGFNNEEINELTDRNGENVYGGEWF